MFACIVCPFDINNNIQNHALPHIHVAVVGTDRDSFLTIFFSVDDVMCGSKYVENRQR